VPYHRVVDWSRRQDARASGEDGRHTDCVRPADQGPQEIADGILKKQTD